ncbi:hypothetical protein SARC_17138, partial [Sphaeroforma arctica JP610]
SLMEERVKLLPFWLPQMEKDIRKKPKQPKREKVIEYGGHDNSLQSDSVNNFNVGTNSGRSRSSTASGYGTVNG